MIMKNNAATSGEHSRFRAVTDSISIRRLERETGPLLAAGLLAGMALHLLLAVYFTVHPPPPRIPRPVIPVDLVIRPRPPRRPPVMGRHGTRRKRLAPRFLESPAPRPDLSPLSRAPDEQPFPLDLPNAVPPDPEPPFFDESPGVSPPPPLPPPPRRHPLDPLPGERIQSPDDLDYGRYMSVVFRDPFERRSIRGFIHIPAAVWGATLTPLERPVIGLAEGLRTYTAIRPVLDKRIHLSSPELHKYPFVYIATDEAFELNEVERRQFADYLAGGGFALLDNGFPQDKHHNAEAALRGMLAEAEVDLGSGAYLGIVPLRHPVYHTYFDFFDGPPLGAALMPAELFNPGKTVVDREFHPTLFLEGLWIRGRLAAIYSDMGYGLRWAMINDNAPQLKFGVNIIVHALLSGGRDMP